jgi:hypothetical protein
VAALLASLSLPAAAPAQVTVSIDTSPAGQQQVIDGFGACLYGTQAEQAWWQELFFDDLQASILRIDLTPGFASPYSDDYYNSPWYGGDPSFPGPDGNNVRTYTDAASYTNLYAGRSAPIAVMGPDIDQNTSYFDFGADSPRTAGRAAQAGLARRDSLGDFKLIGSLWSPAPWVKVSSGGVIEGMSGDGPLNGTPFPFIWGGNFAGGELDVSGTPIPQFDDSALGGTGPTSALTQFARCTAAYLRGFQNAYHVQFYAVSIQNELDFEEFYHSCKYALSSQYIAAITALRAELDQYPDLAGIQIMGPEDVLPVDNTYGMWQYGSGATEADKNLQFVQHVGADPAAVSALAFFCIHGYEAPVASTLLAWNAWVNGWLASPAPGIPANIEGFAHYNKKSWMTESSGEDPAWLSPASGFPSAGAWALALEMHQALTTGQESAYVYWQATDGNPVSGATLTDSSLRSASPKYLAAKHFFRFIRPNAVRVNAAVSGSSALNASACFHPTNQTLTIVLVNSSTEPISAALSLPPTPAGISSFQAFTSSDGSYWQPSAVPAANSQASVSVPAYGVVTLYGASSEAAPSISSQPQSQTVSACSTVSFSVAATGTGPLGYQWLKEGIPIAGAIFSSFTLNNVQTNQAGDYSVVVSGFGDVTSQVATLSVGPATNLPWEQGQVVQGFQDDFNAPTRNPSWIVCGSGGDYYKQANGVLTVTVQNGDPNHLLYQATYDDAIQEVLARIRLTSVWSGSSPRAGIATAVNPSSSDGIDFLFRNTSQNGINGEQLELLDDGVGWGPTGLPFQWKANTWYWVRLRQEPNANGGTNDVFAKVWPSDGLAPEPGPWQLTWDYTPNWGLNMGLAGITASSWSSSGQGAFQVDYVLIKAAMLPSVTVDTGVVPPAISTQPQSQTESPGSTATFSVQASGSTPLCYQWLFNNVPLTGATNSTLTLPNLQASEAGYYSVAVTNWAGRVTSAVALLTLNGPPMITQQPQSQEAAPGTNVTFSVTVVGVGPLSYQWMCDGTNLAGATGPSLLLTNVQSTEDGVYAVAVSNTFGSVASSNAVLLVGLPYGFSDADIGKPTHHGSATPGFDAAGDELIAVNGGGSDIWNASDNFNYYYTSRTGPFDCRVRVRNLTGPDIWSKAELMARESGGAGSRFFANMTTPTSGENGVGVQWRDTTGGAANWPSWPTPMLNPAYPDCWLRLQRVGNVLYASYSDDGTNWNRYYTWNTATLSAGAFASELLVGLAVTAHNDTDTTGATAVFSDFEFDPAITGQPQGQTVATGGEATLGVTASGATALDFQWWFNSKPLAGATNATLTLINVQAAQAGTYWVVVTDAAGSVTSAQAVLTVNSPATITLQPQSQTATAGATVTFSVTAAGNSPLSCQWQFDGTNLSDTVAITGSQSDSLTLIDVMAGDAGNYQVFVTNAFGSATSVVATLTVLPATPVVTWPSPAPITYGAPLGSLQLDATASVPGTFAYSPPVGTVLDAGTASLSAVFTPTDTLDYNAATAGVALVVLQAPLTVAAASATRAYGTSNPSFTGTIAGLVNGDPIAATYACAAAPASLPGSYPIVPSLVDPNHRLANYTVTLLDGTLTVIPAAPPTLLSVTPNTGLTNGGETVMILGSNFESGATVTFGTNPAPTVGFLNSTNLTVLTPPSIPGTVDVVLTNADGQVATLTNGFTYGQQPFLVSGPTNQSVVFGAEVEFAVLAGGTSPLSYQWQFNGANLTDGGPITGSQSNVLEIANVVMDNAGSYAAVITDAYGSLTSVAVALTVLPATPVLIWSNPPPITYGTALGPNQLNATASVPGAFAYSPPAGSVLDAGTTPLSVAFTPNDALDYNAATASVSLAVLKAPLTVAAASATRPYGTPNPVFTGTIVGLINGDSIIATYTCAATQTSPAGSYPIVPALVDPNNRQVNYTVTLLDGTLTVIPAAPPTLLSVTPNTGLINGGETVIILGSNFESGATVTFGTNPAPTVGFLNSTNLTLLTPPSVPGTVDVVLTNADGQVATLTNGFTYLAPPVFQTVTRSGTNVTLTWSATPGQTYQLQYKTDLGQPAWINLLTVTATNSTAAAADVLNPASHRFYRTAWLP